MKELPLLSVARNVAALAVMAITVAAHVAAVVVVAADIAVETVAVIARLPLPRPPRPQPLLKRLPLSSFSNLFNTGTTGKNLSYGNAAQQS